MKWYFALSEASIDRADHDWRNLVLTAVKSARRNTDLRPNLIYDGQESEFTQALRLLGVTIIPHRISFYDVLADYGQRLIADGKNSDWYLRIASGCFLRIDIPLIEKEDEYVLYTDCDVLFLRNPSVSTIRPRFFAVAPEGQIDDYADMNSGVMVINIEGMRKTYLDFKDCIAKNIEYGLDQELLRLFYSGWYDKLSHQLNWKPYWGVSQKSEIVHWHGPKPIAIDRMLTGGEPAKIQIFNDLLARSPNGYEHYLRLWKRELEADISDHSSSDK